MGSEKAHGPAVVTGGQWRLGGPTLLPRARAEGCHIAWVFPAQSKEPGGGVARDLEKHQVAAAASPADVTQRDQVAAPGRTDVVKRFGRLDILVKTMPPTTSRSPSPTSITSLRRMDEDHRYQPSPAPCF